MRRFYIICLLFFILLSQHGLTQERDIDDERTLKTKIADLLNEMPAGSIEEKDALMEDMIALEKEGIVEFSKLLAPPETGGDSLVRYALGSVTRYATGGKGSEHREMVSRALLSSLEEENNVAIKDFLIEQLERVGGNEAVPILANYLDHPELCDRAAMALAETGTSEAEKALGEALESSDETVLLAVVNALGDLHSHNYLEEMKNLARESSGNLRKVSLRALASSGSPEAKDVLLEAARNNNFDYSPDNAVSSLLTYAGRLGVKGNMETMESLCYTIIEACDDRELVHTRIQALNILVTYSRNEALEAIMDALETPYPEYRRAALSLSSELKGEQVLHDLMEAYNKHDPHVKAEIIHAFAERGDVLAIPLIEDALEHENQAVRKAAIPALTQLAREKAVPGLAGILHSDRTAEVKLAKEALMTIAPEHFLPELTNRYQDYPDISKTAVLELIGTRHADEYNEMVLQEATGSADRNIRLTAWKALENTAKSENLDDVLEAFNQTEDDEELAATGNVIESMISRSDNQDTLITRVLQNMKETSVGKQKEYLNLFPEIGSQAAIGGVMEIYEIGSPALKMAAVQTLSQWTSTKVLDSLFRIVDREDSRKLRTTAFDGSLDLISGSGELAAQKLLYYRELMAFTRSTGEKKEIITRIGKLGIFPALAYCGEYLDDPDLNTVAAQAIMNTAIPDDDPEEGMTGEYV
ncbi:MAG: HEAT repeat domain-containing protein, partial [Bacteroidales bacterium]|nr:HEAT repeat domain-containing protein [Bacteroidales bacterium]